MIRTRFAPSPTGLQHIGGFRTALYAFLFARKNKGKFILRIEDTDQARLVEGSKESIYEGLHWLGIDPDEGPKQGGLYGPYEQSQRLDVYKKYVQELIEKNKAYYCFCSAERLASLRQQQQLEKKAPKYDGKCRVLSPEEIKKLLAAGTPKVVRQKMPVKGIIKGKDFLRGNISWQATDLDDHILLKSDGFPTYHLASVVDDHLMEITHVFRGEEWLPSFPKHIALYAALDWELPVFIHLPLLLAREGGKLSKRKGAKPLLTLREEGYLPEAIINFMVFLGWNPKNNQEFFSQKDLIEIFQLEGLNKSGAVYDTDKLDWYNEQYIKKLTPEELYEKTLAYLPNNRRSKDCILRLLEVEKTRLTKLTDIKENINFFLSEKLDYPVEILSWKEMNTENVREELLWLKEVLSEIEEGEWSKEKLEAIIKEKIMLAKKKNGPALWPLRVALTGKEKSPSPFEVAWVIGKKETEKRIEEALRKIGKK